jgi:polysaccharide pyruvyl transferase WcaK-like protein
MYSQLSILITGYYKQQNTGDDLFEKIAYKLFNSKNNNIIIKPIEEVKNEVEKSPKSCSNYDYVILFGGETLNDYFLKPLSKLKELNQNIKLYALGVGLGADLELIKHYLIMFQYIIVRHKQDYEKIKSYFNDFIPCKYVQDIVFLYNINIYKTIKQREKYIGFFLSQPKFNSGFDINNYINIINYYVKNNYKVKLFSMCYNEKQSESDLILNKMIMDNLPIRTKIFVKIVPFKSFDATLKTLKYAICERFHAHILCLIYNIPFISFANTNKVKSLLEDLNLSDLYETNYNSEHVFNKLKTINPKRLLNAYKNTYPDVEKFYLDLKNHHIDNLIDYPKNKIKYYFTNDSITSSSNTLLKISKTIPHDVLADYILMNLFGTTSTMLDYKWGLDEKIKSNKLTLDDIKWLHEQSIYNYYYLHYSNAFINSNTINKTVNIDYIDQYDRSGCHRSGWKYIVDNINNNLAGINKNTLKIDLYVDRTFHWCKNEMKNNNIIPYKTNWIGFIHHTLYRDEGGYNCIELLNNPYFIESLNTCKCLIFLSKYLRDNFYKLATMNNIKLPALFNLFHPTEFSNKLWHYKLWKGDVIQIGSWMRDMNAIQELNYNKKNILLGKNMKNKYICNNNINNYINKEVRMIEYLNNEDYDEILSKYVVFLKLYDASAVNTLIECIVRNTPIIINKLPAVVEYLGENYPLYFVNIEEVPLLLKRRLFNNKIKKAHKYLKNMNKDFLKVEYFINSLTKIIKLY